jgi:flagellar biosynthesis component FlhA
MEAIQLEIGLDLVSYVKTEEEENLIESIRQMRRDIESRYRFLVPPIRVCDNTNLPPRGYRLFIHQEPVARGELGSEDSATTLSSFLADTISDHRTAF